MARINMYVRLDRSNGKKDEYNFSGKYDLTNYGGKTDGGKSSRKEICFAVQQAFLDEISRGKNKGYFVVGAPYDITNSSIAINTENIDVIVASAYFPKKSKKARVELRSKKSKGKKKGKKSKKGKKKN